MGRTLVLAVAGLAVGLLVGLLVGLPGTRLLESLLFEVRPADPVTPATLAALLLGVAALSGTVPALRASRTDAVRVLRGDRSPLAGRAEEVVHWGLATGGAPSGPTFCTVLRSDPLPFHPPPGGAA